MKILLYTLPLFGLGCAAPTGGAAGSAPVKAPNHSTLSGTTANAKGGAVLQADDGRVVYFIGLDSWPDEVLGKRVTTTGELTQTKHIPDPVVDTGGAVSQGAEGEQWVLENAEWELTP